MRSSHPGVPGKLLNLFCHIGLKWKLLGVKGSCLKRKSLSELLTVMVHSQIYAARAKIKSTLPALQAEAVPNTMGYRQR